MLYSDMGTAYIETATQNHCAGWRVCFNLVFDTSAHLQAKNAEIGTFKLKVQELLEAAARIQQQQQQHQQALLA